MRIRAAMLAGLMALCLSPSPQRAWGQPGHTPHMRRARQGAGHGFGRSERRAGSVSGEQDRPAHLPWRPRKRAGVSVDSPDEPFPVSGSLDLRRLRALGLRGSPRAEIQPARWPQEPTGPGVVLREAFSTAYAELCPPGVAAEMLRAGAEAALQAGSEFGVDPFLLAAVARHQSSCRPRSVDSWGLGLGRVSLNMHRGAVGGGRYRYALPDGDTYRRAELAIGRLRADRKAMLRPLDNLRMTAVALRTFGEQCPHIDAPFRSAPHRHAVSHLVWGDHVRSALPEAMILTERRRLLHYYDRARGRDDMPTDPDAQLRGVRFGSPLDGAPRIVIGLLGDPRDGGHRVHYGIDLPAAIGEPVRAVADGVVRFAGVEFRKRGEIEVPPDQLHRVPIGRMGKRGVFVRVDHEAGLRSMYVHLADYSVRSGQRVKRGDVLGTIGLSGMHTSDAHLHFGLFDGETPLDPMRHLGPYLLTNPVPLVLPEATQHAIARRTARMQRKRRKWHGGGAPAVRPRGVAPRGSRRAAFDR